MHKTFPIIQDITHKHIEYLRHDHITHSLTHTHQLPPIFPFAAWTGSRRR